MYRKGWLWGAAVDAVEHGKFISPGIAPPSRLISPAVRDYYYASRKTGTCTVSLNKDTRAHATEDDYVVSTRFGRLKLVLISIAAKVMAG